MPLSCVFQTVVGLLQALWWDEFHIPFSYWLEPFSKSRGPPGSCVKQEVLWKWFISGAQEAFASEDWSLDLAQLLWTSLSLHTCVCACVNAEDVLLYSDMSHTVEMFICLLRKKKDESHFYGQEAFQSALSVFLIATVLLPTLMNSLGMCNMFEDKILLICFWSLSRNTRQEFTSLLHVLVWCFDKVTPLHLAYVYENSLATWKELA